MPAIRSSLFQATCAPSLRWVTFERSAWKIPDILEPDHYLYIHGSKRLPMGLDELEDEIFGLIEGQGDVTGTGTGESGWNIDIEFESANSANFIIISILKSFRRHGISDSVMFNIDGNRRTLADLDEMYAESL